LNTGYKFYSKIIAKRLTVTANVLQLQEQNGFRKSGSCMDCIISASQIIEKYREINISTYIEFIDFKMPLSQWTHTNYVLLCQAKESNTLISAIQKTYKENSIRVNAGNGISEHFRVITQGVRQGFPLLPVLFNLYLDKVFGFVYRN
jgi:signal recognition particle subunit SEC65